MNDMKICQSCGMPMTEEEHFGLNADMTKNLEYCSYCFKDGDFTANVSMEEMVELCIPFTLEAKVFPDESTARQQMSKYFPTLKRWKKEHFKPMPYEVVELEAKNLLTISTRISDLDPNMTVPIGNLWMKFHSGVYQNIKNKKNPYSIGLYTNYEPEKFTSYDLFVGCEVTSKDDSNKDLTEITIEAGKYAKFIVKGNVQSDVYDFWMNLYAMDIDRKYGYDFEEYVDAADMNNAEIHIYISLK